MFEEYSHGFIGRLLSEEVIKSLKARIARSPICEDTYVSDLQDVIPEIVNIYNHDLRRSCIEITKPCGMGAELKAIELHTRQSHGESIPYHQDNFYHCIKSGRGLKLLLALDDMGEDEGGLVYVNASARFRVLEHIPSRIKGFSSMIEDGEGKRIEEEFGSTAYRLRRGEVAYHFLNNVHRAGTNKSSLKRQFIVFRVEASGECEDRIMRERYERVVEEHMRLTESGEKIRLG